MGPLDDFEARHAKEMADWHAAKGVTAVVVRPPIADGRFRRLLADAGVRSAERKWAEQQLRAGGTVRLTTEHQSQMARLVAALKRGGYDIELIRFELSPEEARKRVALLEAGGAAPEARNPGRPRLAVVGGLGVLAVAALVIVIAVSGGSGDSGTDGAPPAAVPATQEAERTPGTRDTGDAPTKPKPPGQSQEGKEPESSSETGGFTGAEANAYSAAKGTCADFGLAETARQLGLPSSSSPEAIAEAYGQEVSVPSFQPASSAGCLAGLSP